MTEDTAVHNQQKNRQKLHTRAVSQQTHVVPSKYLSDEGSDDRVLVEQGAKLVCAAGRLQSLP